MKKGWLFGLFLFGFLLSLSFVSAYTCGPEFACNCSASINGSRTFNASDNLSGCVGDGLFVEKEDIVIDCNGYDIFGTGGGAGITIDTYTNITIINCNLSRFNQGIRVLESTIIVIRDTNVSNSSLRGINFTDVNDSSIINSRVIGRESNNGIEFFSSHNNTLSGNIIANHSDEGIQLINSHNNLLTGGEIYDNNLGESSQGGVFFSGCNNNTITNVYMHNNKNTAIYVSGGTSSNTFIANNNIDDNCGGFAGIYMSSVYNATIVDNNITNGTGQGIDLWGCDFVSILSNNISNNNGDGVLIHSAGDSSNHLISGNEINNNANEGIDINNEDNITISNNNISNNNEDGISLTSSDTIAIEDNYISNNGGDGLDFDTATDINLTNNIVIGNGADGLIMEDSEVRITDTDFINNNGSLARFTGIYLDNSTIILENGDFISNGDWGIYESVSTGDPGSVFWTVTEPVECTDNDINISHGWINETTGYIDADNCTIWINGTEYVPEGPPEETTSSSSSRGTATLITWEDLAAQGITQNLDEGDRITFKTPDGEWHQVKILDISEEGVRVQVASTPQVAVLQEGEIATFDLDDDGFYDLEVTVNSIVNDMADVTIKTITGVAVSDGTDDAVVVDGADEGVADDGGEGEPGARDRKSVSIVVVWVFIVAILIILVVVFIVNKRTTPQPKKSSSEKAKEWAKK